MRLPRHFATLTAAVRGLLSSVRDAALLALLGGVLGVGALAIQLDVPWTPEARSNEAVAACGFDEPVAEPTRPPLPRMPVRELASALAEVVVVDARSDVAFRDGHIPGAISLPVADVAATLAQQSLPLPVDRDIVTYCDASMGADAEYVGRLLEDALGCDRVRVLEGGFDAWLQAGAPVEGAMQSG